MAYFNSPKVDPISAALRGLSAVLTGGASELFNLLFEIPDIVELISASANGLLSPEQLRLDVDNIIKNDPKVKKALSERDNIANEVKDLREAYYGWKNNGTTNQRYVPILTPIIDTIGSLLGQKMTHSNDARDKLSSMEGLLQSKNKNVQQAVDDKVKDIEQSYAQIMGQTKL